VTAFHPYPVPARLPSSSERRVAPRSRCVYRLVRLSSPRNEGFARARNISDTGMKLEATMPLALNDSVTVAFSERIAVSARVVWTNDRECGVAFEHPIDSGALLALSAGETGGQDPRPLRLRASVPATVEADGRLSRTRANDVSLRDLSVAHDGTFRPGLRVRVILDGGRETDAVVRWSRDDFARLHLLEPFSVEALGSVQPA